MKRLTQLAALAVVGLATLMAGQPAHAQGGAGSAGGDTFGQFFRLNADKVFSFQNTGSGVEARTDDPNTANALPEPVSVLYGFTENSPFLVDPALGGGTIAASLTLETDTDEFGSVSSNTVSQPFNMMGSILIRATEMKTFGGTTINPGDLLLSVSFQSAELSGQQNTTSSGLNASQGAGDLVTYGSDSGIYDFSLAGSENFGLTFNAMNNPLQLAGASGSSFIQSFRANGTGIFGAALIPEPSTLALVGLGGLVGIPAVLIRRRARKA